MTGLPDAAAEQLARIVELLANDPAAPSSVTDPEQADRVHVADSLAAVGLAQMQAARRIADIGSGAGFPGLALAAALPGARLDLIEAAERKCRFIERAIAAGGLSNASVVNSRAEEWARREPPGGGREAYDVVTARAVAALPVLAELASPLLSPGGVLVAWKGARDAEEEAAAERAVERTAVAPADVLGVTPYPGSRNRHLHLLVKRGRTPEGLPRRPGMAEKRPPG